MNLNATTLTMASRNRQIVTTSLPTIDLKVTTDENGKIYINGMLVLNTRWYNTYDIQVSGNIEVIAIETTSVFSGIGFVLENINWYCFRQILEMH